MRVASAVVVRIWAALALCTLLAPVTAFAQPATSPVDVPATTASPAVAPGASKRRASEIAALMAGRLASNVDVSGLFASTLSGSGAVSVKWVAIMIGDDQRLKTARRDPTVLTGLTPDEAALAIAQAEFLRQPAPRRAAQLAVHAKQQAAARQAAAAAERDDSRLSELRATIAGLEAFLAGNPTPAAGLSINLLDPTDSALSLERRRVLLADPAQLASNGAMPVDSSLAGDATSDQLMLRVDQLRNRIVLLSQSERERLTGIQNTASMTHASEVLAVERTRQQLAAVNASAAQAQSETERAYLAEQQRLLTVKKSLATAKLELAQQIAAIGPVWEAALGWRRQVNDIASDPGSGEQADVLYFRLINALLVVRRDLGAALAQPPRSGINIPVVPPLDRLIPKGDRRAASLQRLHGELTREARQLAAQANASGWMRRTTLFNAMTEMNSARLLLIPALSRETRARVTGFDEEGLAQVRRELNQIALTTRYNVALGTKRLENFGGSTLDLRSDFIFGVIELLAAAVIFRIWRRRGDPLLASLEAGYAARQSQSLSASIGAYVIGLIRNVRRSLDWLLMLLVARWLLPGVFDLAVIGIVWLILVWLLTASIIIQLIDTIAQGEQQDDPRADLRRRSLRLVFGVILGVGLILSLTMASVGQGAIYSWVLTLCWLLVIPVVVVLANWWRERINALATLGAGQNAILAWSSTHPDGLVGVIGRIAAGALLLVQGGQSIVARWINQLALIREISGQRSREKAAARVIADEASGRYVPIPLDQTGRLSPHGPPTRSPDSHLPIGHVTMPELRPGRLIAVVGERGLGKTTAISGLFATAAGTARKIVVTTGTNGFDGIVRSLAEALDCLPDEGAVSARLAAGAHFVAIDDTQRLVIPAIGGLAGFDRVIALARATSSQTGWAFAIGGPAWNYLTRARADRTLFDDIVILRRWKVGDIRGLIERRTAQAGLEPRFNLEVYKAGTMLFDSDISPDERARRGFFEELTSQSDGNPAVALEFWRRSLFEDRELGSTAVRTYKAPDVSSLLALPKASLFVLRAILQMEIATFPNIIQSTDLPPVVVSESLHALVLLGVIVETTDTYRLTLYWYQDVRHLLERQNLIVRGLP